MGTDLLGGLVVIGQGVMKEDWSRYTYISRLISKYKTDFFFFIVKVMEAM